MGNIFRLGEIYNPEPVVISVKSEEQQKLRDKKSDLQTVDEKINKRKAELDALQKQGHDIVSSAERKAKDLESQAEQKIKESEKVLKDARKEAEKITADARTEAEKLKTETEKKARNEGQKKGYDEGLQKGIELGKEELKKLIEKAGRIRDDILNERQRMLEEVEEEAVKLILNIAQKVVRVEAKINKDMIIATVAEAVKRINDKDRIIVHVNPQDIERVKNHRDYFIELIGTVKEFDMVSDITVLQGGCIIETNLGNIDATLDSQYMEIEKAFMDILRK